MVEREQAVLRVQPHMLPSLRQSFKDAASQVHDALSALNRDGYLPAPWLGDEVSGEVADHYLTQAMDGPSSAYRNLVAYRDELIKVHDTLARMEDEYRRREGDDAARWGRMA